MIRFDVTMPEYLAMDALSSGVAHRAIYQSPLHALSSKLMPRDSNTASNKGEIFHKLLLEGHEEGLLLVDAPDWRTKAAKEAREAAYEGGLIPLLAHEIDSIRAMVQIAEQFIERSEVAEAFQHGAPEVTVDWDDDGVKCKARPDLLSDKFHVSVKTTNIIGGANPARYARMTLTPNGYDFGLAFYRRGLLRNGVDVEHRILVVEQQKPHGCSVLSLAPSKAAIADLDVQRSIDVWRKCEQENYWPAYDAQTFEVEATPWELAEAEARELLEDEFQEEIGVAACQ